MKLHFLVYRVVVGYLETKEYVERAFVFCERIIICNRYDVYRGADNSLARPGRKQATATEDFDVHLSYLLS